MTTTFGPDFDAAALATLAPELADVFTAAGFTTDGVAGYLGPEVTEALFRGEPAPVSLAAQSESQMGKGAQWLACMRCPCSPRVDA